MSQLVINALLNSKKVKTDSGFLNVFDLFDISLPKLEDIVNKYYNSYKKMELTPPCFKTTKITSDEENYNLLSEIYTLRLAYEENKEKQEHLMRDNNKVISKLLEIKDTKKLEEYKNLSTEELDALISKLNAAK